MSLQSEIARFASVDVKGMQGLSNEMRSGVGGIDKIMKGMGAEDDELERNLAIASSALQAVAGSMGAMRGLQAMWEMRNDLMLAEGGLLTAAKAALGPIGWTQIAIAATASAGASAAMYAIVNDIEVGDFDLSTSAGMSGMLGALEGMI